MQLRVHLCGSEASWRFLESTRLDQWLAVCPWQLDGGVIGLRVSGARQAALAPAAITDQVRVRDAGASEVRCRTVSTGSPPTSAQHLLTDLLEIAPTLGERAALEALARSLDAQPHVFVIDATAWEGLQVSGFVDQALAIRDALRKLRARVALTVVVLHCLTVAPGRGEGLEVDLGAPAVAAIERPLGGTPATWRAYLHQRLAWESGGSLDRALAWDEESRLADLAPGADAKLEAGLNDQSRAGWRSLAPARRDAVMAAVNYGPENGETHRKHAQDVKHLIGERLYWRPLGTSQARPVPWIARALLLEGSALPARPLLRSCLVCGPLLRECVMRCLDLEAQVRAIHHRDRASNGPEDDDRAARAFEAFQSGIGSFDHQFYPAGCPATPPDVWAFAEFGRFIHGLRVTRTRGSVLHELRQLRNSLAHGHYVSYRSLELLASIERQLGE